MLGNVVLNPVFVGRNSTAHINSTSLLYLFNMITAKIINDLFIVTEAEQSMQYTLADSKLGKLIKRNGLNCGLLKYIPKKNNQGNVQYWLIQGTINHFGLELVFDSVRFDNIVLRNKQYHPKRYKGSRQSSNNTIGNKLK